MQDAVFEDVEGGRGPEFGTQVHEFAEAYAGGAAVDPRNDDEMTVKRFLDGLDGELLVEEEAYLPVTVDGERMTITGVIDLIHVTPESVEIVDYKTDLGRHAESEYRKQLSVYYHVVSAAYPDRPVSASLYTSTGEKHSIEPLDRTAVTDLVRTVDHGAVE
jgi:ATP-dependent exoDNAse (exonuclease V) beta subunit